MLDSRRRNLDLQADSTAKMIVIDGMERRAYTEEGVEIFGDQHAAPSEAFEQVAQLRS